MNSHQYRDVENTNIGWRDPGSKRDTGLYEIPTMAGRILSFLDKMWKLLDSKLKRKGSNSNLCPPKMRWESCYINMEERRGWKEGCRLEVLA